MAATVRIDVRPVTPWWRPIVQWVLCIPHLLLSGVLTVASIGLSVVLVPVVLVRGRVPQRLAAFQVMTLRERVRCYTYFFVLRSDRPPVALSPTLTDPGDDPFVELSAMAPPSTPRWSALARPFVLLPHLVVLVPVGFVMDACYPVWMVLAAANRGWPPALERLLIQIERWVAALALYGLFVSNDPPRFGLASYAGADTGQPSAPADLSASTRAAS